MLRERERETLKQQGERDTETTGKERHIKNRERERDIETLVRERVRKRYNSKSI